MPPKKNNVKPEPKEKVVKEVAKPAEKPKQEVKAKTKETKKSELKENKKWAEVTDEDYHDEENKEQVVEENSEESESCSDDSENEEDELLDEEALLETLKSVSAGMGGNKSGKSIVDFDYEEVYLLDLDELSDYDTNTLLKVLMVRGTKTNNPILWSKCSTLLKLLNFEMKPNAPYRNNNYNRGGYRGGRGGYRGGGRGGYHNQGRPYYEQDEKYEREDNDNETKDSSEQYKGKKNWRGGGGKK
jgi:hypothetical protein